MTNAPILRRKEIADDGERPTVLKVYGGLNYLRGNAAPHFSLTGETRDTGGCIHDLILKHFPELEDLARLHLADINGAPMYAQENGFYFLGGTHWQQPNFKAAADHFRITEDEARALVVDLFGDHFSMTAGFLAKGAADRAKARLGEWIGKQRPRWKAEADACIAKHGLVVFGDEWKEG